MKIPSLKQPVVVVFAFLAISQLADTLCLKADEPPKWINDKPKLTFKRLAPADVKLVSAPKANEYVNFGPGFLDQFIKSEQASYALVPQGLKVGAMHYTDRVYKIELIPEPLRGLTLLRTMQGHKPVKDPAFQIAVEIAKPAYVFVAIDDRKILQWHKEGGPDWLKEFSPTGLSIITDDPAMREKRPYSVVAMKAPAGHVKLGPARGITDQNSPAQGSMYFAFFGVDSSNTEPAPKN